MIIIAMGTGANDDAKRVQSRQEAGGIMNPEVTPTPKA